MAHLGRTLQYSLEPPPDFFLTRNATSVTLPFDFINNHIYVSARLNGRGPFRFLVDTGWGTSSITPEVATILRLNVQGAQKTMGAGEGTAEAAFTKVGKMQFGDVQLLNQSLLVSSAFDGKTRDAVGNFGGLIGYELFKRLLPSKSSFTTMLRRFNITFDYDRREMIFERNVNYSSPDVFDRSGMYVNKGPAWFEVVEVVEGGPADEAGIRPGDRIVSIDGKKKSRLSLPQLRLKFKEPVNTRIRLMLQRNGSTRKVVLVLRDLV